MTDDMRPITIFGAVLLVGGVIGLVWGGGVLFFNPSSPLYMLQPQPESRALSYFWIGSVIFYVTTGFGVLYRTRWGYRLFKVFLYILLLGFPIGTFISYITLSYMKRHYIEAHFSSPSSD